MASLLNAFLHTPNHIEIRIEHWHEHVRYLLLHRHGECQVNVYQHKQEFGGEACIYGLYVDDEHRHKGIGRFLLETAETIVRNECKDDVYLEYDTEHTPVCIYDWYMKSGYKFVELHNKLILMRKTLTAE